MNLEREKNGFPNATGDLEIHATTREMPTKRLKMPASDLEIDAARLEIRAVEFATSAVSLEIATPGFATQAAGLETNAAGFAKGAVDLERAGAGAVGRFFAGNSGAESLQLSAEQGITSEVGFDPNFGKLPAPNWAHESHSAK